MSARVALLLPSLRPPGIVRVAANLAAGLRVAGIPSELWAGEAKARGVTLGAAVPIVDLEARAPAELPARVTAQLRRTPVEALIGFSHPANRAALEARAVAVPGARVAVTLHMTLSRFLEAEPERLARVAAEIGEGYAAADAVIAVSEGVAQDVVRLAGLPRSRIQVVGNPILTPEIPQLARQALDHPWFLPGEPPVILGAGRLVPQKDFATLIRAFRHVRDDRPARLLILGEGRERNALLALIGRLGLGADVALPGHVTNPFAYLARAAAFALSSVHEGLPTVLVEALACGVPVVSTDCPSGPREVLEDGRLGPLVGLGRADDLGSALLSLLDRPPEIGPLRARAEFYSVERAVTEYCRLLGLRHEPAPGRAG